MSGEELRADVALCKQGLASSRERAQALIGAGLAYADGAQIRKSAQKLPPDAALEVRGEWCPYVSRGGFKLEKALRAFHVDVTDISRSGIGFKAAKQLEVGTYYDTRIQIWTREIINAVIEIVRRSETESDYIYGGEFIGMSDTDALKIDIYQIFNDI